MVEKQSIEMNNFQVIPCSVTVLIFGIPGLFNKQRTFSSKPTKWPEIRRCGVPERPLSRLKQTVRQNCSAFSPSHCVWRSWTCLRATQPPKLTQYELHYRVLTANMCSLWIQRTQRVPYNLPILILYVICHRYFLWMFYEKFVV